MSLILDSTLLAFSRVGSRILPLGKEHVPNDLESNDYMSYKRIITSTAVLLVNDSTFFHRGRAGTSVFDLVRASTTEHACYGIWERKLCKVRTKLEDSMLCHPYLTVLCLSLAVLTQEFDL